MRADDLPFEAFRIAKDAAKECMRELDMVAHKPVQGEAMHKVMGWQVLDALAQAGWIIDTRFHNHMEAEICRPTCPQHTQGQEKQ